MVKRANLVGFILLVGLMGLTSANMIVMWNGTSSTIPVGWTCDSCRLGFPLDFYNAIPRINSTFCGFDGDVYCYGSTTHRHTITGVSTTGDQFVAPTNGPANSFNAAGLLHTHGVNITQTLFNNSIPRYYSLLFITWNSSTSPQQLTPNMIVFFNSTTPPTNFSLFTPGDNYFPYGSDTAGTIGGNDTHIHTNQSIKSGGAGASANLQAGLKANVANTGHTHTIGVGSIGWDSQSDVPLYVNMTPIFVNKNTSIPVGMVGMFNATPTGNWSIWDTNKGYYVKMSTSSFNDTGGNSTHTHTAQNNLPSGSGSAGTNYLFGTANASGTGHTHRFNVSVASAVNSPPATETIFAISNGSQEIPIPTACWSYDSVNKRLYLPTNCLYFKINGQAIYI